MDDLVLWIGAAAVACSVPLLWWSLSGTSGLRRSRAQLGFTGSDFIDLRAADLARPVADRLILPRLTSIGRFLRRFTPVGIVDRIERRLILAGKSAWGVERILVLKVVGGLVGIVVGLQLISLSRDLLGLIMAVVAAYGLFRLPEIYLSSLADRRQAEIARDLPDVLDQVLVSVEAGLGFDSALMQVSQSGRGPLAAELARVHQDIALGLSRHDAYDELLKRTASPELRQFVNAMKQADRNGVPMANVLRVHARDLREQRSQRAEERAQKLQIKIVFPVILCILPALFVVILGPAVFRVMDTF
jgi:tight adherence protein C